MLFNTFSQWASAGALRFSAKQRSTAIEVHLAHCSPTWEYEHHEDAAGDRTLASSCIPVFVVFVLDRGERLCNIVQADLRCWDPKNHLGSKESIQTWQMIKAWSWQPGATDPLLKGKFGILFYCMQPSGSMQSDHRRGWVSSFNAAISDE